MQKVSQLTLRHPASQRSLAHLNLCPAEILGELPHVTLPSCVSTFARPYSCNQPAPLSFALAASRCSALKRRFITSFRCCNTAFQCDADLIATAEKDVAVHPYGVRGSRLTGEHAVLLLVLHWGTFEYCVLWIAVCGATVTARRADSFSNSMQVRVVASMAAEVHRSEKISFATKIYSHESAYESVRVEAPSVLSFHFVRHRTMVRPESAVDRSGNVVDLVSYLSSLWGEVSETVYARKCATAQLTVLAHGLWEGYWARNCDTAALGKQCCKSGCYILRLHTWASPGQSAGSFATIEAGQDPFDGRSSLAKTVYCGLDTYHIGHCSV